MIHTFLKLSFYFVLSFLILSIPVKNTTLFDQLSEWSEPYMSSTFSWVKRSVRGLLSKANLYGKQIYSNARPSISIPESAERNENGNEIGEEISSSSPYEEIDLDKLENEPAKKTELSVNK